MKIRGSVCSWMVYVLTILCVNNVYSQWYYHGKPVNVTLQNRNLQEEFGMKAPDSNTYIPYLGQIIDLNGRALSVFSGKDSNKLNVNLNIPTASDKPSVELKDPYSIRLNKVNRNGKSITVYLLSSPTGDKIFCLCLSVSVERAQGAGG